MALSPSGLAAIKYARHHQFEEWCCRSWQIDQEMQETGAPPLNSFGKNRLALRLQRISSVESNFGELFDRVPSGSSIARAIFGIRASVDLLARFQAGPKNSFAIRALGEAASEWRSQQPADSVADHFETEIRTSEGYVEWRGGVFIKKWLAGAKIVNEILKSADFSEGPFDGLNWPKTVTELQGASLPDLYRQTYSKSHVGRAGVVRRGGRDKEGNLRGPLYTFVAVSMQALGYQRPKFETIRTAIRQMGWNP